MTEFLLAVQKIKLITQDVSFPVSEHEKGYRAQPAGPGTDFFPLYKRQEYSLPFKVEGMFNINMADERVVSDDRVTVITKINREDLKRFAAEQKKKK